MEPTLPKSCPPRFSVLHLVLLTTIVALGVNVISTARRASQLQARNGRLVYDNERLRGELGLFDVKDPAKIHAIRLPDEGLHRYRVYLPAGRRYTQYYTTSNIPAEGVPEKQNGRPLKPGMYLCTVDFEQQLGKPTGSKRLAVVKLNCEREEDANATFSASVFVSDWTIDPVTNIIAHSIDGPGKKLELHDPANPFVIYRDRAQQIKVLETDADGKPARAESVRIPGEADGFLWWIESEPIDRDDGPLA
jgi:hypothetical protein